MSMTNFNRHLLEAHVNWCVENNFRPYIQANAKHPGLIFSQAARYVDFVPLCLSANALRRMEYTPDGLVIDATFGGVAEMVLVPYDAIASYYTPDAFITLPDNPQAAFPMVLPALPTDGWVAADASGKPQSPPKAPAAPKAGPAKNKVSHLRVIK